MQSSAVRFSRGNVPPTQRSHRTIGVGDCVVVHLLAFTIWILWNTGHLGFRPIDPFPLGLMTTIVSLEAIFLSIFVLMAQKRESAIAELREELGLR